MKRFILSCLMLFINCPVFAGIYANINPDFLKESDTKKYEIVNQTSAIIFNKVKKYIRTDKYPKYYHDFTLIKDDGTQSKAYYYVKNGEAELIYFVGTNELKFISFRRPELQKCRIMYDYPSGKFNGVQIFVDNESFMFSPEGKYVNYTPYVKDVHKKVQENWKVPSRKDIEKLAKDQKDLLVQVALVLNKNGSVKNFVILKSSKIKILDENAGLAVKKASPFKPFPENFFNEELVIILNFNFSL